MKARAIPPPRARYAEASGNLAELAGVTPRAEELARRVKQGAHQPSVCISPRRKVSSDGGSDLCRRRVVRRVVYARGRGRLARPLGTRPLLSGRIARPHAREHLAAEPWERRLVWEPRRGLCSGERGLILRCALVLVLVCVCCARSAATCMWYDLASSRVPRSYQEPICGVCVTIVT